MTTNQDRAAEVIEGCYPSCRKCQDRSQWGIPEVGECDDCADQCKVIAQALADAGLLMADLPEPVKNYDKVFIVASPLLDCRSVQAIGDQVAIHGYESRHASSGEARRFAYALLAAADHAEKEKK